MTLMFYPGPRGSAEPPSINIPEAALARNTTRELFEAIGLGDHFTPDRVSGSICAGTLLAHLWTAPSSIEREPWSNHLADVAKFAFDRGLLVCWAPIA